MTNFATPRVSVVIPLFQKAPYLHRALVSVFQQTLRDIEVIVVDDGSTDDAHRILREAADDRLVVHVQEHRGVSAARNQGIAMARSPWVGLLDADDEWLPEFLESTLSVAESLPRVSGVFSNFLDQQTARPSLTRRAQPDYVVHDYFQMLLDNRGLGASSSSVLASRSQILDCGGFPIGVRHGEDLDLWARLAWAGTWAYCDSALAICHTEVADSVSKDRRSANALYPTFLRTYEQWAVQGWIPTHLRASSLKYANWVLSRHLIELAHQGLQKEAQRRLRDASWHTANDPHIWRARLWNSLPTGALRAGRDLSTRLTRWLSVV